jgi:MATE family multidrug resistance protein
MLRFAAFRPLEKTTRGVADLAMVGVLFRLMSFGLFSWRRARFSRGMWKRVWKDAGATLGLAIPIMAGHVGQMLMGLADTLMIGRVGVVALAASSFANSLVHVALIGAIGFLASVAVQVSHAYGARDRDGVASVVRHGLAISAGGGVVLAVVLWAGLPGLRFFGQSAEVVAAARPYIDWLVWSLPFALITVALKNFTEAVGSPWPGFWVVLGSILLNIFLNWVLIFGNLGAPAMGLEGAGIATFLARIAGFVAILVLVFRHPLFRKWLPARWREPLSLKEMRGLFLVGFPVSLQLLMEVGAFAAATIMMGWFGVQALAAHQIALTCASTTFMFALGISQAVTIRVGQAVGGGLPGDVRRIGFTAVGVALLIMGTFAGLFFFGGALLASAFTEDRAVIELAVGLLMVAAFFQLFDGTQVVSIGALRGLRDVRVPTVIVAVAYWVIGIPLGYLVANHSVIDGIGVWMGLAFGLGSAAILLLTRFHRQCRRIWPAP